MNSSNNLKSGQKKLSMQMLILVAVIVLVAAAGLWTVKSPSTSGGGDGKASQMSTKLLKDITTTQSNLYKIQSMVSANQDKKEIEKFSDQQAAAINDVIAQVKKALDSDISAEQKKFYQGIMGNLTEYQKSAVRFMKLAPAGTGAAYLSAANEKMEAISGLITELAAFESKGGNQSEGASGSSVFVILIILFALLLVSVFLIPTFIKSMINNHVVEPLQETAGALRDYSNGKFGKQLEWDADDAIGELVQTVNVLRTKMSAPAAQAAPAAKAPEAVPVQPVQTTPTPAAQAAPAAPPAEDSSKSLSDMVKKTPERESLVISSKKAIDKLQDI